MWKKLLSKTVIFAILLTAGTALAARIDNPITASSFTQLIEAAADAIQTIALVLAPIALVFVGIKFVTSSGNEKKLTEAKTMFWWVLIGTAIVVGASVLAKAVVNTVKTLN